MDLVGRLKEKETLADCIADDKSHFIVVYGRRRVGKTYLVRRYFNNNFDFYATGLAHGKMEDQLFNFHLALNEDGSTTTYQKPKNWLEAFNLLVKKIKKKRNKKKVIFIDELPWMDTPRSGFMSGLEYFWNSWASNRDDIILITCGSAASWMINKLINNKGGLYNRVTRQIKLQPFTLGETEQYLKQRKYHIDRFQIVQLYMVFGGIPFYLDLLDTKKSVAQNIDSLCFSPQAALVDEYRLLFKSLFEDSYTHKEIIDALSGKTIGLPRKELVKKISIEDGGGLTRALDDLVASDFIRKYRQYGKKSRQSTYQLIDSFCLFYHNHMKSNIHDGNYWINLINSPKVNSWQGNAFEMVCLRHIDAIKKNLGISGVQTSTSTWWGDGAQIDLIIDRKDQIIHLVEIKFSQDSYKITKRYADQLRNKTATFRTATKSKKTLWTTMITTYGLGAGSYNDYIHQELTMEDLF